jgi:hypothetical protein
MTTNIFMRSPIVHRGTFGSTHDQVVSPKDEDTRTIWSIEDNCVAGGTSSRAIELSDNSEK